LAGHGGGFLFVLFERLEARTGCVKRVEGGLEAAHCLGFERGGAVPAACHSPGLRIVCDPRTLRELATAPASAGEAGVDGAGHAVAWSAMSFAFRTWRGVMPAANLRARSRAMSRFNSVEAVIARRSASARASTLFLMGAGVMAWPAGHRPLGPAPGRGGSIAGRGGRGSLCCTRGAGNGGKRGV